MVRRTHPDCPGGDGDPALFQQVREAYATLSDPDSRLRYDLAMGLRDSQSDAALYRINFEGLFDRLLGCLRMEWWEDILRALQEESD